ncbi:hypothetical protein BG015_005902 [Linnemannia schmuckeri]|uniref:BZIP domain-containing protein n=1 Tax=Linnemannia schmuckeri TaxID=64567 RepID=A0A9P5S096_9FUNG|nr:hypothetical protein BG015_005902 [Linnemannia schmuckeri]
MSSYQSTSSEADESKLKTTPTTNKRARSSSQGGQSSQDEHLPTAKKPSTSTSTSSTTTTTTTTTTSSSSQPAGTGAGSEGVSPAVNLRKEQNRAAQRAFRDRKERHLQQLENLIQDLKDQQFLLTTRFQREIQQLKIQNQVVIQENQYLKEVVFAFESALNYRGDMEVLQDVKQGLYRRYVGKQVQQLQRGGSGGTATIEPQEQQQQQQQQPPPPLPPVPASPSPSLASSKASLSPALQTVTTAASTIHSSSTTASAIPSFSDNNNLENQLEFFLAQVPQQLQQQEEMLAAAGAGAGDSSSRGSISSPPHRVPSASGSPPVPNVSNPSETAATESGTTTTPYSINREILYRAPASLHISELNSTGEDVSPQITIGGGLLAAATTPLSGGGIVPLSPFFPAGTPLPKVTDYTKHPTVFDELQSSLFPPGTLQSLVSANMASPQDVVNDTQLFDQLGDKGEDSTTASESTVKTTTTTSSSTITSTTSNGQGTSLKFSPIITPLVTTSSKSPRTTTQTQWTRSALIHRTHRLQNSFKVLAAGPVKMDPKIDPQIYQIPHDARVDLIPCPKLRAQMILHQHKYNIDEVFQLLIDKAICHGSPLNPRDWELPEEFFERFGFLIGVDLENQRRRVWPRPLPPDMV